MQRLYAIHAWHAQVEQHHVRSVLQPKRKSFLTIPCSSDYVEVLLGTQHAGEASADDGMIINDKNADFVARFLTHHGILQIGKILT